MIQSIISQEVSIQQYCIYERSKWTNLVPRGTPMLWLPSALNCLCDACDWHFHVTKSSIQCLNWIFLDWIWFLSVLILLENDISFVQSNILLQQNKNRISRSWSGKHNYHSYRDNFIDEHFVENASTTITVGLLEFIPSRKLPLWILWPNPCYTPMQCCTQESTLLVIRIL